MSRIAVFSDIHGNLAAMEAVLQELEQRKIDTCWYLGDLVVYGPQPSECIDKFIQVGQRWPCVTVRGNNDNAIIKELLAQKDSSVQPGSDWRVRAGIEDTQNPQANERRKYIIATELSHAWTIAQLTPQQQEWLIKMPSGEQRPMDHVLLVHAGPCESIGEEGNYLHEAPDAEEAWLSLREQDTLCFFGHTHCNVVFRKAHPSRLYDNTEKLARPAQPVPVDGRPLLVNPGSVGQPRDGLSTASYAIYDTESQQIEFYRVKYDLTWTINALHNIRDSLAKTILELNGRSSEKNKPYESGDAAMTIGLLSKRLQEAR